MNVLVALLLPEHEHHVTAQDWFTTEGTAGGGASCAITELGAIRVCPQLPGGSWPPESSADRLLVLTASIRGYVWWPDVASPTLLPEVRDATTATQVTDRYLLGLARRNGGRLATFDRALADFGRDDVVSLLPRREQSAD